MKKFAVGLPLLGLLLAGCSASVQDVKYYDGTLAPGDGILVVAVDTMIPFSDLRLIRPSDTFSTIVARGLPQGRTIRFVEVPAGDYEWATVDLTTSYQHYWVPLDRDKRQHLTFSVKPGVINYPGDFVLMVDDSQVEYGQAFLYSAIHSYYIRSVDRNATLLDDLTPDQAKMVARFGLVYVGPGDDRFQTYYDSLSAPRKGAP